MRATTLGMIAVVLLLVNAHAATPAPRDLIQDAIDEHDKQIQAAKKLFDGASQKAGDAAIKRLITVGDAATKSKNDDQAQRAFKEILRIDRANQRAREFFTAKGSLDQLLTELTIDWKPVVLSTDPGWDKAVLFECLLGRYKGDTVYSSAVTLAIPDGTNIFTDDIRHRIAAVTVGEATNGKVTWWEGKGYFVVPKDGTYIFKGPTRRVEVDGKETTEVSAKPQEVPLKQGRHSILVTADAQYNGPVAITITDPRSGSRISLFNPLDEIKLFLRPPTEGQNIKRTDVSRWSPDVAKPVRITLP